MARPLRLTGFTRFFLVMLFIAPLAYIGASYYNGEDGIQKIKELLNIQQKTADTTQEQPIEDAEILRVNEAPSQEALKAENLRLKEELAFKKKRVDELYLEIEELKRKLESAEKAGASSNK